MFLDASFWIVLQDYDEISFFHRNKMVSLLLRLNRHCNFHPETFALAVNLLDRFLTVVKVLAFEI